MCGSWRRHRKPFSLCIFITCSSNAGSIDFCSNNLSVCLSLPVSLCVYFSMHPQTITNTESMLLRHQSNTSSFFILEMPPPSFKAFQNRHTQKIKSLYNKQPQLLTACLTESNRTPKEEPAPQEKPKQNKHPTIPELTLFMSNNSLHCCYRQ